MLPEHLTALHYILIGLGVGNVGGTAVLIFKVNLMWADYKKRHHINGDSKKSIGEPHA